jgi:transcriptional antiterminator RfaH
LEAWYLVTTKLKSELRVKQNLIANHGLATFFPVYPARKASSPVGLPLFPRYVFVQFDLERDYRKVQFTPGVSKIVAFGEAFVPVPTEVIDCLRQRCDTQDILLPPELLEGQKVRVRQGIFDGCVGIIREKRGHRRVQLLLEMAYGLSFKVEVDITEVEPMPS